MTSIGSSATAAQYIDRSAQIRDSARASNGQFTEEDVATRLEEFDKIDRKFSQTKEARFSGKLKPVNGSTEDMATKELALSRAARSEHYKYVSGPVRIRAMNVDSAVKAQGSLTGGDLKDLTGYADYLRSEVAAASNARPDVTFMGTWGKDRVTSDVNEYIGWLYQAAQNKSPDTK